MKKHILFLLFWLILLSGCGRKVPSVEDILKRGELLIEGEYSQVSREELHAEWGEPLGTTRYGNDIWKSGDSFLDVGYSDDMIDYINCSVEGSGTVVWHDAEHGNIYWVRETSYDDVYELGSLVKTPDRDAFSQPLDLEAGDVITFRFSGFLQTSYPGKSGSFYSVEKQQKIMTEEEIRTVEEKAKEVIAPTLPKDGPPDDWEM